VERETGLEPATVCLEGRCATTALLPRAQRRCAWSGREDSNLRLQRPKRCALNRTAPRPVEHSILKRGAKVKLVRDRETCRVQPGRAGTKRGNHQVTKKKGLCVLVLWWCIFLLNEQGFFHQGTTATARWSLTTGTTTARIPWARCWAATAMSSPASPAVARRLWAYCRR
jgi:hypothetical protein